jgi:hypothetical protein
MPPLVPVTITVELPVYVEPLYAEASSQYCWIIPDGPSLSVA